MPGLKNLETTAHADEYSLERLQDAKYRGSATMESNSEPVNLNSNLEARIQNPLAGYSRSTLLYEVEDFARKRGLEDVLPLLKKGALVARDPTNYEDITGDETLDDAEVEALRNEIIHKWRQPRALYFTIIACSIGAAVQGWDQTGSNGANLSFPKALGIGSNSTKDSFLIGLINSGPYIGSAAIGCWISAPLNHFFGRRGAIFAAANVCVWAVLGSAFVKTWQQLLICRILLGFGMGTKASTVPIYAAETSPAAIRGALVMSWQVWTAFGIFLGFSANLAVADIPIIAWRLQFGSAFIPAIPLMLMVYFCPESPRWYMKNGQYRRAFESLLKLRLNPVQAARDLYTIHAQLELEKEIIGNSSYKTKLFELFTIPRLRRATLAAFTVMLAQQMCGINIIAFYSSTIFSQAGTSFKSSLWASWGFGLINFIFVWPAIWTIDTYGRRTLLLFTFPNMAWSLMAAGLFSLLPLSSKAHVPLVAISVYIFTMFYSPGEGPVPFTYSAEVFPLSHREVGMGFAVAVCLGWAAVLSITLPRMLQAMSIIGTFGFYAGLNVIALCMIFLWVPETKQRTLEELDYVFAVPTRKHMNYQVTVALPWWVNRYIFMRRGQDLPPLYHFDRPSSRTAMEQLYEIDDTGAGERVQSPSPYVNLPPTPPHNGAAEIPRPSSNGTTQPPYARLGF